VDSKAPQPSRRFVVGTQTDAAEPVALPSTLAVYKTPKPRFSFEEISDDDDDDDVFVDEDARAFGRDNVGPIASPYILPYFYNRRYLDTQQVSGKTVTV